MKNRKAKLALLMAAGMMSLLTWSGVSAEDAGETQSTGLIAETKYGSVSGVAGEGEYEGITMFKGIPYATAERWETAQEIEPWDGVYEATEYGPIAIQSIYGKSRAGTINADIYMDKDSLEQSEDCLYLNITTSYQGEGDTADRPVYIWLHGGGQDLGYSYEPEFDGSELAKRGVVVVSVEMRLNTFGFLALPQLTEEQGTSGNYAISDEVAALNWVLENIEAFGGDPDNITLGGQSGGTAKALVLAITPDARGKIKNLILESGFGLTSTYADLESAEQTGIEKLEALGYENVEDMTLIELRALPARDIQTDRFSFIHDGVYIQYASLAEAIEDGALDGVNILCGTNLGENTVPFEVTSADEFYDGFRELFGDLYEEYDFESLYQVTDEDAADTARVLATMGVGTTDSRNLTKVRLFTEWYTEQTGADCYVYLFSHFTPSKPEEEGTERDENIAWAWHSSEMWYAFNSLRDGVPEVREWEDYDFELADIMCDYWANFISTSNPNSDATETEWPKSDENMSYLELGDEITAYTEKTTVDELLAEYNISAEEAIDLS